jgi:hypothetical protein
MPSDPWGDAPGATVVTAPPVSIPIDEQTYACPHCGEDLKPHYDAVGSLHCYSKNCVNCCFLPPDATSEGKVRGKFEAKPCPMAAKVSGF